MKTNNESGHILNVANFSKLLMNCSSFDGTYQPTNPMLLLAFLLDVLDQANHCLELLHAAQAKLASSIAARENAFKLLSKLTTRICNAVKASSSSDNMDEQVKTICRKLQGRRVGVKKVEETNEDLTKIDHQAAKVSTSQMSINNRIENFDRLIKLLISISDYAPNEEDLKVKSLIDYYNDLKVKNTEVINADIELNNLRIKRNELLYKEKTGLTDLAQSVKTYVKSVYGTTSPQYRKISALKFVHFR